jgi:hypothetical protein
MRPIFRLCAGLLAVVLMVTAGGCDSVVTGDNIVVLNPEISSDVDGAPIRFTFSADDLVTGRLTDIQCNCQLDVESYLVGQGFAKSDIVSASIASARLVMLFPISERLDFLDQAILKLQAPGNSVTEIASQSIFPESREVSLDPQTGRDISGFMDRSTFQPILQIDAIRLVAGADYEIGVVLKLRLEVDGL